MGINNHRLGPKTPVFTASFTSKQRAHRVASTNEIYALNVMGSAINRNRNKFAEPLFPFCVMFLQNYAARSFVVNIEIGNFYIELLSVMRGLCEMFMRQISAWP